MCKDKFLGLDFCGKMPSHFCGKKMQSGITFNVLVQPISIPLPPSTKGIFSKILLPLKNSNSASYFPLISFAFKPPPPPPEFPIPWGGGGVEYGYFLVQHNTFFELSLNLSIYQVTQVTSYMEKHFSNRFTYLNLPNFLQLVI